LSTVSLVLLTKTTVFFVFVNFVNSITGGLIIPAMPARNMAYSTAETSGGKPNNRKPNDGKTSRKK